MVGLTCEQCGTPFEVRPHRIGRARFCSPACRSLGVARGRSRPLEDRFWEKVDRRSPIDCWHWVGARVPLGYGYIGLGSRVLRASRVSFEMHKGAIPRGMMVRHTCDSPSCVNPDHLILGTQKDNMQDMVERGRCANHRKVSEAVLADIRAHTGTVRQIAALFGVSAAYVSMVKTGKRRKSKG